MSKTPLKQERIRQEKRAQRLTFGVRRPPGGVGVFHVKGWWPKSSCPPSKVCLPWVSKRGNWDVPGILPGCPAPLGVFKKFVPKPQPRPRPQLNSQPRGATKWRPHPRQAIGTPQICLLIFYRCLNKTLERLPSKRRKVKENICYVEKPRERNSGEIFRRHGRKMWRKMWRKNGEIFRRFSSFNFQEKWAQEISRKIGDKFG